MIAKSKEGGDHLTCLKKLFDRLRQFKLRLNPKKCVFGASSGKLLGYIVSERGIEIDPSKARAIIDMPPPKTEKEIRGLLGRLQYISRFIARLTPICEPIFKLLRKNAQIEWNEDCQQAFDKIKKMLIRPPILVPPTPGRPLFLYLSVTFNSMGAVLGQQDDTGKKEQAIYYLSKKFTSCEEKYSVMEKYCLSLVWATQKLRHYMMAYPVQLISRHDPIRYLFEKLALVGRCVK
jgi:hypothetical protein